MKTNVLRNHHHFHACLLAWITHLIAIACPNCRFARKLQGRGGIYICIYITMYIYQFILPQRAVSDNTLCYVSMIYDLCLERWRQLGLETPYILMIPIYNSLYCMHYIFGLCVRKDPYVICSRFGLAEVTNQCKNIGSVQIAMISNILRLNLRQKGLVSGVTRQSMIN